MSNKWIQHVKQYASDNNISYACALTHPDIKKGYNKTEIINETTNKNINMNQLVIKPTEYEIIRDELKKYKFVVYIVFKNKSIKYAFRFNGNRKELIKEITKQYLNKNEEGMFFVIFKFSFHTGTKVLQGGPLALTLSTLIFIDNELVNGYSHNPLCPRFMYKVWFQKKYLIDNGWDDKYLNNIIKKLLDGKAKLYPGLTNLYNINFI